MRTEFLISFERDLQKLAKDKRLLGRIRSIIEAVEATDDLQSVTKLKRLSGGEGDYYRFRVGDYRIGAELKNNVVIFVRCLHRREIYRYFP